MVSLNHQKLMSRDKDKQQRPALPLSAGDWWARPGGHTQHKTEGRPTADPGTIPHITPHGRGLFRGTRTPQNRSLSMQAQRKLQKSWWYNRCSQCEKQLQVSPYWASLLIFPLVKGNRLTTERIQALLAVFSCIWTQKPLLESALWASPSSRDHQTGAESTRQCPS